MRRDYYAVLGIAATAEPREIRQAYRRLARQYSPDVNFWDERARLVFEEIAEAYRILGDPRSRAMYDRLGHGDMGRGGPSVGVGRRGEDEQVGVELSLAEVMGGAKLPIEVSRFSVCAACRGAGTTSTGACAHCRGRGVRRMTGTVTVDIPPGVDTGTQIRVKGEGSAGPLGGPRGDLIVSARVREHPHFKRKGDSVHCEVPISVWEAVQGARIRIPTPAGEATIVIPPATGSGQMFRLRGQGAPKLADGGAGDLYVTVRVDVPAGLDARTHELVRELERLMPLAPRTTLERYRGGAG
jgi:molecular chaperone DnaJ